MVELALAMPVVMLLVLGVVQVAVAVRDDLLVQHAAREAARAASVSAAPAAAASGAGGRVLGTTDLRSITIGSAVTGGLVRVTVRAATPTDVPLIGGLLGDVHHVATAVMVLEPP